MADDRRQQLADDVAAVLAQHRVRTYPTDDGGVRLSVTPHAEVAALLLPLLDRVAADAAAEALSDAADYMHDWGANAARYKATVGIDTVENATATARELAWGRAARNLQARAAELRAPARTDEEN